MANLTSVGLTSGLGTSGTGTISTLDNLIGTAGSASAQVLSVQGIASGTPILASPSTGGNTAAVKSASTAPLATDPALVVSISPNSVNANGQATMANSAPVAIASNQSTLPINVAQVNGTTVPVGSGVMATAERICIATDSPGLVTLGGATPANSVPVVQAGYTYAHIAAGQATTTVKSGAGVLHSITFHTAPAATSVMTIYDNTAASGTVIGIATAPATPSGAMVTLVYDIAFATGLTIITATANGADMTVSYR